VAIPPIGAALPPAVHTPPDDVIVALTYGDTMVA
jgi:hypothetical protein